MGRRGIRLREGGTDLTSDVTVPPDLYLEGPKESEDIRVLSGARISSLLIGSPKSRIPAKKTNRMSTRISGCPTRNVLESLRGHGLDSRRG